MFERHLAGVLDKGTRTGMCTKMGSKLRKVRGDKTRKICRVTIQE